MAASDFRAVPGTKRARFENAAGVNISRRSYEDLRSRERGFVSYRAYQASEKQRLILLPGPHKGNDEYERLLGFYTAEQKKTKAAATKPGSEFNELFAAAYVREDGSIRDYFDSRNYTEEEKGNLIDLFWLLYACGFVGTHDHNRYVRN